MSEDELFQKLEALGKEQRADYLLHAIKNLITPIMGYSYMLAEHTPVANYTLNDGTPVRDILRQQIYDNAHLISRVFQQLAAHPEYRLVIESRENLDPVSGE
jgi:hypothetical protein